MRILKRVHLIIASMLLLVGFALAQPNAPLGENAALRYWAAFSQVQDTDITDKQANELNAILDGTAPYDDSSYKDLLEKNTLPLAILARATSLPHCDWGLDYGLKDDLPVDYARKALVLGRMNVLNIFHLSKTGNKDGAVLATIAGLRFSRDVANGGSLFATVVAKDLLTSHLRAVADLVHFEQLSAPQRTQLEKAVQQLGPHGVNWQLAIQQEMELLHGQTWPASLSSVNVTRAYVAAVNDPTQLSVLEGLLAGLSQPLRKLIPTPRQVVKQKQELDSQILQTRMLVQ